MAANLCGCVIGLYDHTVDGNSTTNSSGTAAMNNVKPRKAVMFITIAITALVWASACGTWTYTPPGSTPDNSSSQSEPSETSADAPTVEQEPPASGSSKEAPESKSSTSAPSDNETESAPSGTPTEKPEATWAELVNDMRTARRAISTFWREHWLDEFDTGAFDPPEVKGLYDSRKNSHEPSCGGDAPFADNAFYCGYPEHFVAWDEQLMRRGSEYGDAWVYLIIAHEYGHSIQAQIDQEYVSKDAELQADCLAAAALYGASKDGNFTFQEGDLTEVVNAYREMAGETPWTNVGDHGDALERISWFEKGRSQGATGCFPN